jgi:hypothetical protein
VKPDRGPFTGRAGQQIAFISDPDGNIIELMQIPVESRPTAMLQLAYGV